MPSGAKNWVFTVNNYTSEDEEKLLQFSDHERCVHLVFGRERGESGTPHLQGYLQLGARSTLAWVRREVHPRAHWEISRGTPEEASQYCKKDGDYEERGTLRKGQGRRSDLDAVVDLIKQGKSKREIAEEHPAAVLRYGRGIDALRICTKPSPRVGPPEIQVYWGRTGLGKTRRVHSECPQEEELWVHPGDKWFDGYDGQPCVLFDDFDGGWFKLGYLLKLLDRYTFQVPIKGGYVWWAPQKIFITSNIDPKLWYQHANDEQNNALIRRLREFGTIVHFDSL